MFPIFGQVIIPFRECTALRSPASGINSAGATRTIPKPHFLLFNPKLLLRLSENRKVRNITQWDLAAYLGCFLCLFNQQAEAILKNFFIESPLT